MAINGSSFAFMSYESIVGSYPDVRTKGWFMTESLVPVLLIVAAYLYFSISLGPRLMLNRKPFQLKHTLIAYNALNVALSVWVFYECLVSGWWRDYNLRCQPMDLSDNPKALRMARMCWVYFLCKILELMDTVFFVLRKKYNQVTFLHLYHHSLMPVCLWLAVKFVPGGHVTSGFLLNSFIHIIMYLYYLLAALGPKVQKYLWWKKYLTALQLVQFLLIVAHQSQLFLFKCDYPRFVPGLELSQALYFFYLFGAFYLRSYTKKPSDTHAHEMVKESTKKIS